MKENNQQITMKECLIKTKRFEELGPRLGKRLEAKKEVIDKIIEIVAQDYALNYEDLLGLSRRADVVQARHIAAHFLFTYTDLSFKEIALSLGRNDHTTAMNAIQNVEKLMKSNPEFRERIKSHPLSSELSS